MLVILVIFPDPRGGPDHSVPVDNASSVFDAVRKAVQQARRMHWYQPAATVTVLKDDQKWQVSIENALQG